MKLVVRLLLGLDVAILTRRRHVESILLLVHLLFLLDRDRVLGFGLGLAATAPGSRRLDHLAGRRGTAGSLSGGGASGRGGFGRDAELALDLSEADLSKESGAAR